MENLLAGTQAWMTQEMPQHQEESVEVKVSDGSDVGIAAASPQVQAPAPLSRKQQNKARRREYQLQKKRDKKAARLLKLQQQQQQPLPSNGSTPRTPKELAAAAAKSTRGRRPCLEPVAAGCGAALLGLLTAMCLLPRIASATLLALLIAGLALLRRGDRWAAVRLSSWRSVRRVYQSLAIYHFMWRLTRAYRALPPPEDACELHPRGAALLDAIIATGPRTYQQKATNRAQIESLLHCVCGLVDEIDEMKGEDSLFRPLVLDIGAGKALFTRAIYEALGRRVAVVALDSRRQSARDRFYDPPPSSSPPPHEDEEVQTAATIEAAPYTRIVADVAFLAEKTLAPLQRAKGGGVVAVTKHLCGGATDGSLMSMCASPLDEFIGACCLAPCCHQKTKREEYCNIEYLKSFGFCATHVGTRGATQDPDWRTFGMLLSISKMSRKGKQNSGGQYKNSVMLRMLGFTRACELGRMVRRVLEEGRMRYLRDAGFEDVRLVKYCTAEITGDNLAIIATRKGRVPRRSAAVGAAPVVLQV